MTPALLSSTYLYAFYFVLHKKCFIYVRGGHLKQLKITRVISPRGALRRNRKTDREVQENSGKSLSATLSGSLIVWRSGRFL